MNDEEPWLEPQQLEAWVGLIKLAARITALGDGELRRAHGITGRDYEVLHHLSQHDAGQRVTELARLIDDTSSCITHRVNRLAEAGLVQKFTDPDDQRVRRVELTAAGRSLLTLAAPDHARRVRRWVIDPLSARDIADLARVTRRLNDHLRATEPATGSQRNVAVVSRPSS